MSFQSNNGAHGSHFNTSWIVSPHFDTFSPTKQELALNLSVHAVLGAVGAIFCSGLVFLVLRDQKLRTRPNLLFLNLLLSDILAQTFHLASAILATEGPVGSQSNGSFSFCVAFNYLTYSLAGTNIFSLTVISLERYAAIVYPYNYKKHMRRKYFLLMIALPWILPFLLLLPIVVEFDWTTHHSNVRFYCRMEWKKINRYYLVFFILVTFCIPFLVLIFTNTRVHKIAKEHLKRITKTKSQLAPLNFESENLDSEASGDKSLVIENKEALSSNRRKSDSAIDESKQKDDYGSFGSGITRKVSISDSNVHDVKKTKNSLQTWRQNSISNTSISGITECTKERSTSMLSLLSLQKLTRIEFDENTQQQIRILFSTYFLVLVFVFCWSPQLILKLLRLRYPISDRWIFYTNMIPILLPVTDPVILLLSRKDIRSVLLKGKQESQCL